MHHLLHKLCFFSGHSVNDGSDDQANDEPYDHDVGTLRHNDFPNIEDRNIEIKVMLIIIMDLGIIHSSKYVVKK